MTTHLGPRNSLTDVAGIRVGHATCVEPGYLSGVTVVLADDEGAVGAVDVRGGGPGTRETDALDPRNLVPRLHAVVLTGGSAYGLATADGVADLLGERGIGYRVGDDPTHVVPVVAAAALFDLGRGGSFRARPTYEHGASAARVALQGRHHAVVAQGCVGAGQGCVVGGIKGGVGSASVVLDGDGGPVTVAALVAVNAFGSVIDQRDGRLIGAARGLPGEFDPSTPETSAHAQAMARLARHRADGMPAASLAGSPGGPGQPLNTTIGVVATDAIMDRPETQKIAGIAHDGLARAIHPVHTLFDGDTIFALSTSRVPLPYAGTTGHPVRARHARRLTEIGAAAADCVTRAVVHAVLAADPVTTPAGHWPTYRELYCAAHGGQV